MKYEVFISYKHSDEQGNLTPDYAIAKELYDALHNLGYQVFFSSNTLEQIGSSRYKADIDAILSALMLLFYAYRLFVNLPAIITGTGGPAASMVKDVVKEGKES